MSAGEAGAPRTVSPRQARELLDLAHAARQSVRRRRRPLWLPLMALGLASAAVTPLYLHGAEDPVGGGAPVAQAVVSGVTAIAPTPLTTVWWVVVFAVAYGIVAGGFRNRQAESGLLSRPWVWLVVGILVCASTFVAPATGSSLIDLPDGLRTVVQRVPPGLGAFWILAAGLLAAALAERQATFTWAAVTVGVVTVAVSLYNVTNLLPSPSASRWGDTACVAAIAAALLISGGLLWRGERRSPRTTTGPR